MSSTARFRNPPPGPPNDPTWMLLDGSNGWPVSSESSNVEVSPLDCAIVLQPLANGGLALTDDSGRFGGLVPPPNVALSADDTVWLLDRKRGRLRRFDDCGCAFVDVPCTGGIGSGARQLVTPRAIAMRGRDILVLDSGPPGRVLVFTQHGFALRAIWFPPPGAVAVAWQPSAIATAPDGRSYVADVANGAVHVFDRAGVWRAAWLGFGAVTAMTVDRFGRIYTFVAGETTVQITGPDGVQVALTNSADAVHDCFPHLHGFASDSDGRINLAGSCAGAGWFDDAGTPSTTAPAVQPGFPATGVWLSTALDSAIGRCQWHRLVLKAKLPPRTSLSFAAFTAEVAQPIELVAGLPPSAWTAIPLTGIAANEALIQNPPGRYLWLRATLSGDQQSTPRLDALRIEYPRISLRRYLPRGFAPDTVSGDFTDRLLGVFDQGFRSVESEIDRQADLLDPRSAPATAPVAGVPDMLSWLASWIGVTFDRSWPVARRRRFLMKAAALYPCRGTLPGMRRALMLYLGLDTIMPLRHRAACLPACAPPPPAWQPPPLILEHWKIRRWLFVGAGRLGDAAVLWGETIMGRSQLDNTARLGATRLDTTREAVSDPFNDQAYAFTVFVPGGLARSQQERGAIRRMLANETPAWTKATLRFVLPRMRIGVQASIGFDSVVGCWPEGVLLDQAHLGRATVLSSATNVDPGARIGQGRIGSGVRIA